MIGGPELVRMLAEPSSGLVVTPIIDAKHQIGDASIDVRLGPDIIVSRRATGATAFDPADSEGFQRGLRRRQAYVRRRMGDPFHLQPGEFVLARTLEYVALPDDVSAQALGRSSWGRLGLTIATATLIQPGFQGTITLELANVGNTPIVLEVGLSIAQLVFSRGGGSKSTPTGPSGKKENPVSQQAAGEDEKVERARAKRLARADAWYDTRQVPAHDSRYTGQVKPALSRLDRDRDLVWVAPISIRYIVGVVGERFAGKSTLVNFLVSRRQFRLYRLSQFVYEEARRRGVDVADKDNLRRVGDGLRDEFDADVIARLAFARIRADHLDAERSRSSAAIVIEGFKVPEELAAWQRLGLFRTLLVEAPPERRLERGLTSGQLARTVDRDPLPAETSQKMEWLARNVDDPDGLAHPARPVVEQALSHGRTIRIGNAAGGVPDVVEELRTDVVPALERWWRGREF